MEWLIAHGLVGRSDLPIPEWLFGWAAAIVLIVSFVALAVLWPEPKLEGERGGWRRLFALPQLPVDIVCGAIGVFLFGVTIWAGFAGEQTAAANWASTFVYVIFWLGFAAASVLLGDVFRAFNPWRAIARAVAGVAKLAAGGSLPAPLPYPERLGRWPAAAGIFAFAFMELAATNGDMPQNIVIATLVYSAATWIAMALYGIEPLDRARRGVLGLLQPVLAHLGVGAARARHRPAPAAVGARGARIRCPARCRCSAVMIGSVTFDGAAEGKPWVDIAPDMSDFFQDLGLSPENALMVTYGIGLLAAVVARLRLLPARHRRRAQRRAADSARSGWPTRSSIRSCRSRSSTRPRTT